MARVTVTSGRQPYTQQIEAHGHQWLSDEPTEKGGLDRGPTPSELLLSSLGSCIAITLQMYAARKKWVLDSVSVDVEGHQAHPGNRALPEYAINVVLKLEGPLSEDQKTRLLEIAGRCPIKRILTGRIHIRTLFVSS